MPDMTNAPDPRTSEEVVRYSVESGIATIKIDRPERRNALSVAVTTGLFDCWNRVDNDPDVRVAIVTSADCGTFCAGADLVEAAWLKQEQQTDMLDAMKDPFFVRMRAVEKPIIAAMTGHMTAGGFLLSLNSDLRVGMAGTRAGITEVKVGRGSPWAMPLLWMLPQPIIMELVLTGELMPIEKLENLGFINYVEADADAVRAKAQALAEIIRDNAPLSVQAGKVSLMKGMSLGCDAALMEANRIYRIPYASEDAIEGPRAFAEKRPPQWKGR